MIQINYWGWGLFGSSLVKAKKGLGGQMKGDSKEGAAKIEHGKKVAKEGMED